MPRHKVGSQLSACCQLPIPHYTPTATQECYGKYVDLHDIYNEYNNLPFNFDNPSADKDAVGANALAAAAARHSGIDYPTFLQVPAFRWVSDLHCDPSSGAIRILDQVHPFPFQFSG